MFLARLGCRRRGQEAHELSGIATSLGAESSARAQAREAAKVEREHDEGDGEEDEAERQKLVKQDEYREMHKRGSGNRYNRS